MITQISEKLAKRLCGYADKIEEAEYVRYGLEVIIGGFFKILILLAISSILHVTNILLSIFLTFAVFRSMTGGHHYSTYLRCLVAGIIIMIGASEIVFNMVAYVSKDIQLILLLFSILFGIISIYLFAPSNHFYKDANNKYSKKLRNLGMVATILWGLLLMSFIAFEISPEFVLASIVGYIIQVCTILPFTYCIVRKIELLLDKERDLTYEKNRSSHV